MSFIRIRGNNSLPSNFIKIRQKGPKIVNILDFENIQSNTRIISGRQLDPPVPKQAHAINLEAKPPQVIRLLKLLLVRKAPAHKNPALFPPITNKKHNNKYQPNPPLRIHQIQLIIPTILLS